MSCTHMPQEIIAQLCSSAFLRSIADPNNSNQVIVVVNVGAYIMENEGHIVTY